MTCRHSISTRDSGAGPDAAPPCHETVTCGTYSFRSYNAINETDTMQTVSRLIATAALALFAAASQAATTFVNGLVIDGSTVDASAERP